MKQELSGLIDNQTVQFASYRRSGSSHALLDRSIKLTGPQAVIELIQHSGVAALPELIAMLQEPSKAWAAEVILTSITGADGKIIESFQDDTEKWWTSIGINSHKKWADWYQNNSNNISWNSNDKLIDIKK